LNYSKNLSFEENWAKQGDEIADLESVFIGQDCKTKFDKVQILFKPSIVLHFVFGEFGLILMHFN
jgi:hypothetical protein